MEFDVVLAPGASFPMIHGFGYPPATVAVKQVGITWVDATGTYDLTHDVGFTTVTLTNTSAFVLTYHIRLV